MQTAASAPPPASWHDDLQLGYGSIDRIHEEFVDLVDALIAAPDGGVAAALASVHVHSREHFASEEQWMQENDFPARDCHAKEHAAVLQSMEGVARRVAGADFEAGRHLARALADWFPGHAELPGFSAGALDVQEAPGRQAGGAAPLRRRAGSPRAGPPHLEMTP
jgi:hemerythrin